MGVPLNIPAHSNCVNCGACCGPVPAQPEEVRRIRAFIKEHPEVLEVVEDSETSGLYCPFRDWHKRLCAVYPVRPMMCRLFGVISGVECRNGNSANLDGRLFLAGHTLGKAVVLMDVDWFASV